MLPLRGKDVEFWKRVIVGFVYLELMGDHRLWCELFDFFIYFPCHSNCLILNVISWTKLYAGITAFCIVFFIVISWTKLYAGISAFYIV